MRYLRAAFITALIFSPWALFATPPEPVSGPFNQGDEQVPPAAAPNVKPAVPAQDALTGVTITWFGQSCFAIQDKVGHLVLTDPFDPKIGYSTPTAKPTILTVSHEHADHNDVTLFPDFPLIVKKIGETGAGGLVFHGIPSWHDNEGGKRRGPNTIFVWKEGELRLAHLGDLGQSQLTKTQLTALRNVDVLFIPVGGHFTIDSAAAFDIVNQIRPKVVIPMHYKTPAVELPLEPVDNFLKGPFPVQRVSGASLALNRESLPHKTTLYVLDYASHQGSQP